MLFSFREDLIFFWQAEYVQITLMVLNWVSGFVKVGLFLVFSHC